MIGQQNHRDHLHPRRLPALIAFVTTLTARPTPTSAQQVVDPAEHQAFADDLVAILYTNANECSSALGVSMAFSLVWPGCTGDAIGQVRDALGYPHGSSNMQLVWEGTTQVMLDGADGRCEGSVEDGVCDYEEAPLLKIANAIGPTMGAS